MPHASRERGPRPSSRPPVPAGGQLVLGRYRPVRRIGAGGMGVVWLAHDEKLDRPVAVKRISVGDETVAKRAAREAKAAARLAHPAIVALYETGRDEDAVYLVSELVVGSTLAQLLAEGALSDRDVLRIGVALCEALAHAHGRGVVHRDVKPQNIIVPDTQQGATGIAKLTDFGIAMLVDEDVLTRTGDVVGTLAYMAPEQAEGLQVTAQADLYALGLVIYEALSGTNPVRGRTAAATVRRVGERLPRLERLRRDLAIDLCVAIDRAVDPDPRARGKVTALRTALRAHTQVVDEHPGTVEAGRLPAVTRVSALAGRALPEQPVGRGALVTRVLAASGAAALSAAALAGLGPSPPLTPATGALVAAVLVAVLPRLGSVTLLAVLAGWLLLTPERDAGLAVLVVAAGLPTVLGLWRQRPGWWSAPALAPLLGLVGLALVWPAIAGQARRLTARIVLGALGCWWLLLAQALTTRTLLVGPLPGVAEPQRWAGSAPQTLADVLAPLVTGGALGIALVWALAAAVLPYVVRGRTAAVDLVMAAAWAAGLAAGTQGTASVLRAPDSPTQVHGLVLPAILAGVTVVVIRSVRPLR